jgi:uncharacterized membrane protein
METHSTNRKSSDGKALPNAIAALGAGLGVAELAAPTAISRLIGLEPRARTRFVLRLLGARELASAIGIFATRRKALPMWSRVAGDAIDLALLGWALRSERTNTQRAGAALASVAAVTLLDVIASAREQRRQGAPKPLMRTITINRAPHDVYAFFRDFNSLPTFMHWLESVEETDDLHSRWVAKLPAKQKIAWTATITEDVPGRRISWVSTSGPGHRGTITFQDAPGKRGTEVHVVMSTGIPLAKHIAGSEIDGDLRRLKQMLETGEVTRSGAREEVTP